MGALRGRAIGLLRQWGLTICLVIVVTSVALLPRVQDHIGYILPWRLPAHVFYKSRRYNVGTCMSKADVTRRGDWPLRPIGLVFMLFGLPRWLQTSGRPHRLLRSDRCLVL